MTDHHPAVHTYAGALHWRGSTGAGYEAYTRAHDATAPPARAGLRLSSDPAFRGDPALLNPEQLLVIAAASCQLLSFLALAARGRIDVVAYDDDPTAEMPEDDPPVRITRIDLRPRITVVDDGRPSLPVRIDRLVGLAHEECFVANSLRSHIAIAHELTIVPLAPDASPAPIPPTPDVPPAPIPPAPDASPAPRTP